MATPSKRWKASYDCNRKYNSNWEQIYRWLEKSSDGSQAGFCKLCECTIVPRISNISNHEKSQKHRMKLPPSDSQSQLTTTTTPRQSIVKTEAVKVKGVKVKVKAAELQVANSQSIMRLNRSMSFGQSKKERPISQFPIPDVSEIPPDMQEVIEEAKEKAGFIPNVFKTLSHRPNEMRAFVNYHNAVMEIREGGNLTKGDKEMIIVAVSAYNKCTYCIIAHSAMCRIYSKNKTLADQIAANWETADIDDRQRAILTFAMAVTKCEPLSDEHFEELYRHRLDQEDAWDIGSVVALFSLSNRMAFLTGMVANEEFYMLGRTPWPPKDSKL